MRPVQDSGREVPIPQLKGPSKGPSAGPPGCGIAPRHCRSTPLASKGKPPPPSDSGNIVGKPPGLGMRGRDRAFGISAFRPSAARPRPSQARPPTALKRLASRGVTCAEGEGMGVLRGVARHTQSIRKGRVRCGGAVRPLRPHPASQKNTRSAVGRWRALGPCRA